MGKKTKKGEKPIGSKIKRWEYCGRGDCLTNGKEKLGTKPRSSGKKNGGKEDCCQSWGEERILSEKCGGTVKWAAERRGGRHETLGCKINTWVTGFDRIIQKCIPDKGGETLT